MIGTLRTVPALDHPELLADPVAGALARLGPVATQVHVAPIDARLADTAQFCAAYDVPLEASANCVVVHGRRGGETRTAACLVLATMRADVNGMVKRHLDVRKASFAPMEEAVAETGMEYGGITPLGLPAAWPLLVAAEVTRQPYVVMGSGVRHSKLVLPGAAVAQLPGATVLDGLALPVTP